MASTGRRTNSAVAPPLAGPAGPFETPSANPSANPFAGPSIDPLSRPLTRPPRLSTLPSLPFPPRPGPALPRAVHR